MTIEKTYSGPCRVCDRELKVTIEMEPSQSAPEFYRVRCSMCGKTSPIYTKGGADVAV